jgi:hypothetical protein
MNKKILKNMLLYINIATSLFCIILAILEELIYKGIFKYKYYGIFAFEFKTYYFLINIFYCIIGIILFIKYIMYNKIRYLRKYLLLIPSLIISLFLIYSMIYGIGILTLLFIIGLPLFLFFYLNQDNKIFILILLNIVYPISVLISLIWIIGVMGI